MRRRTIIAEHLFNIIAVSDNRRTTVEQFSRKHPVWSSKIIAATPIILDDQTGSISLASLLFVFYVNNARKM